MRYIEPSFSTFAVGSESYRANHDRIFGKKDPEPASAGSCEPPSREAEFEAFDRRVAEVEAKVTAGNYDDARVSDTYTPEEALLHAFYNWRDELRVFIAQKLEEYGKMGTWDPEVDEFLYEIYRKAYSGPSKNVALPYQAPPPGAAVEYLTAKPR